MDNVYINEHQLMKLKRDMSIVSGLNEKEFNVHIFGDLVFVTILKNIKGYYNIYNNHGIDISVELTVSSCVKERYLDAIVRYVRKEYNIPIYYHKTGIAINRNILHELSDENGFINMISNFQELFK